MFICFAFAAILYSYDSPISGSFLLALGLTILINTFLDRFLKDEPGCLLEGYDLLYARWLQNPEKLLVAGGFVPGMSVLDLQGGTGTLAKTAKQAGSDNVAVLDLVPRAPEGIKNIVGDVNQSDGLGNVSGTYDLVVCRQGVGYWDLSRTLLRGRDLHHILAPGGKFVFNNFTKPKVQAKLYQYNSRFYFECSWFWKKRVFHVQASPGLWYDVSKFYWNTERELREVLSPFFEIDMRENMGSQTWICTRKDTW